MEKKFQVFISSTFKDLESERQEIVQAILKADHIPAGMEVFKGGRSQDEIIKEWLTDSDIYILLLGARYGSLRSKGDMSYTEWEFNLAKEFNIPHFVIALDDTYINAKYGAIESELSNPKFDKFRKDIFENEIVAFVSNSQQIKGEVSFQLNDIIKKNKDRMLGWIRGTVLDDLESAQKEIFDLREKLDNSRREVIEKSDKLISIQTDTINRELDNIPDEFSQLIKEITAEKDEYKILRNEMKWITEYIVNFGNQNKLVNPNPDNEVIGNSDGKYGGASLTIGKNILDIRADYQINRIEISQFLRDELGNVHHEYLSAYHLRKNNIYKNKEDSPLNKNELLRWIKNFLNDINSNLEKIYR
ncbi:DUF4062 domain-containing protein [Carnobacterium gallinarum]|uniref:DUF4062 domain-containing protein n=1 Tax=Carnobacterium gallinarum TaxID=2749 RepID=UPI00068C8375|nr:DUF4062 domain-containing protein [Carnobacterium gallinarum]